MLVVLLVNVIFLHKKSFEQKKWISCTDSKVPFCHNWKIEGAENPIYAIVAPFYGTVELGEKELFGCPKLFLNANCSLFFWSKLKIGNGKWFLNTNLFLIKTFLITKFDCTIAQSAVLLWTILWTNLFGLSDHIHIVLKWKLKTKNQARSNSNSQSS